MREKLFTITDAYNELDNISKEQALVWAKVANAEYRRLRAIFGVTSEVTVQRKSIAKASQEIIKKYGTRKG